MSILNYYDTHYYYDNQPLIHVDSIVEEMQSSTAKIFDDFYDHII